MAGRCVAICVFLICISNEMCGEQRLCDAFNAHFLSIFSLPLLLLLCSLFVVSAVLPISLVALVSGAGARDNPHQCAILEKSKFRLIDKMWDTVSYCSTAATDSSGKCVVFFGIWHVTVLYWAVCVHVCRNGRNPQNWYRIKWNLRIFNANAVPQSRMPSAHCPSRCRMLNIQITTSTSTPSHPMLATVYWSKWSMNLRMRYHYVDDTADKNEHFIRRLAPQSTPSTAHVPPRFEPKQMNKRKKQEKKTNESILLQHSDLQLPEELINLNKFQTMISICIGHAIRVASNRVRGRYHSIYNSN